MFREAHSIKPASGGKSLSQVVIIQAEYAREKKPGTDAVSTLQVVGGTVISYRLRRGEKVGRRVLHFATREQAWSALERSAQPGTLTWVFSFGVRELAAALGLWDLFLEDMASLTGEDHADGPRKPQGKPGRWRGYCVLESPPTVIQFKLKDRPGHFRWVDVQNYGVDSLGQLLADLCHPGHVSGEGCAEYDDGGDRPRVKAEAVEAFVTDYLAAVDLLQLGSVQSTAASQAMHAYRFRFLDGPLEVHGNKEACELERQALFTGRCECRHVGPVYGDELLLWNHQQTAQVGPARLAEGGIWHLDVNSLYPFVALDAVVPTCLRMVHDSPPLDMLERLASTGLVFARVKIVTEEPAYPCRVDTLDLTRGRSIPGVATDPLGRIDPLVIWPVGEFWTSLAGPELRHAVERDRVVACSRLALYDGWNAFGRWVRELHASRQHFQRSGRYGMATVCKRLLNSLFGKFAQLDKKWQDRPEKVHDEPFDQWWRVDEDSGEARQWRSFAWNVQELCRGGESNDSMPAVTAWITSLGRMHLWHWLNVAGPSNVLYHDTDSLWVNGAGYQAVKAAKGIHPDMLGCWKVVGMHKRAKFMGIKHYVADDRLVCAGLPRDAKRQGDTFATGRQVVPPEAFLWQGRKPGAEEAEVRYTVERTYRHGVVSYCGTVRPLRVMDTADPLSAEIPAE